MRKLQIKSYCQISIATGKGKGKAEHLYSALHGIQTTLKRSGMDHTVLPAINTMPAFTS